MSEMKQSHTNQTMKRFIFVSLFLLSISFCQENSDISRDFPTIDLLIKNAKVYGSSEYNGQIANVYIVGNKIAHVGRAENSKLDIRKIIDGTRYILSPGFIDLHSHGDPLNDPDFDNFLSMGVTTITLGQDGFSPDDLPQWIDEVNKLKTGPNIAMFVGHSILRNATGIRAARDISAEQEQKMDSLLSEWLPLTFGLSTGLEYHPAIHADTDELVSLARVVGKYNRLIMSHMRNEDDDKLLESISELIAQGKFANVHISHLKSVYGKGVERAEEILAVIQHANNDGIRLTADVYPYNASYTGMAILFPPWSKTQADFDTALKTRRTELETFIRNKVISRNGPEATLIGSGPYKGKTLKDLETDLSKPFEKIVIEDIGPVGTSAAYFVMDEYLQNRFIQDPLVGIGSDGSPTMRHPRGHGTFARIIEAFVVKDSLLSLEDAIYKMTEFPASLLKIHDRGKIKAGYIADLILFKPSEVKSLATYENPHMLSKGFDYVVVNGQLVIEIGERKSINAGVVLKPLTK